MMMFLVTMLAVAGAQGNQKLMINNLDRDDMGIYFLGQAEGLLDGSETYCDIVAPGQTAARYVSLNDSFVFRSSDLKWRVSHLVVVTVEKLGPFLSRQI